MNLFFSIWGLIVGLVGIGISRIAYDQCRIPEFMAILFFSMILIAITINNILTIIL